MTRSVRIVKSSERTLSRAALLKSFKSRQIKACVTENPAGCLESGGKTANPFRCIHYCNDLEETRMMKMKGEQDRIIIIVITGHVPVILNFSFV